MADEHDDDDDKLHEGLMHLQAAAREMIRATRSLLDAAEELVDDPRAVQGLIGGLGTVAQAASARLRADRTAGGDDDDGGDQVQRIKVS